MGLWGVPEDFPLLEVEEWKAVLAESRRQAVLGVVYEGAKSLSNDRMPPQEQSVDLLMESYAIERRSAYVQEVFEALTALFRSKGLSPVVQKGPSVAQYYRNPLSRRSGDIDFYFSPEEFASARKVAEGEGIQVAEEPDGSLCYRWRNVTVEHHGSYYDSRCQFPDVEIPSAEATLLLLSTHILKHAIGAGIGLKQFCDAAVAFKALDVKYDRASLARHLKKAGLLRWQRMLEAFLCKYLGVEPQYLPVSGTYPKAVSPEPLMEIVMEGGDFGHYNPRRSLFVSSARRKRNTLEFFMRRIPFALRTAPREWFHTLWRLVRGNLSH